MTGAALPAFTKTATIPRCPACGIDVGLGCAPPCPRYGAHYPLDFSPRIALRPYQMAALRRLRELDDQRPLVHWATGLGKTVLFAHWLTEMVGSSVSCQGIERGLVLAHRDELIEQAVAKIAMVCPLVKVGVIKAERNELDAPIIVASVQTLANPKRLRPLMQRGVERIVVDEAHHAEAESYQRILAMLGAFRDDGPRVLGVTATPIRGDGKQLDNTWDRVIHRMTILDGIKKNYLCNLRGLVIQTKADFSKVKSRYGDIVERQAEEAMMQARAPEDVAHAIHQHAGDRPTLVFTPGVESSQSVAHECRRLGIDVAHLDGTTPLEERRSILRRFHEGDIQVVSNCAVLTEGYDEERIGCVVVARPTESLGLYVQMIGRGTRLYPGKKDCLVLDVVGATHRHDLLSLAGAFAGDVSDDAEAAIERGTSVAQAIEVEALGSRAKYAPTDLFSERAYAWVKTRVGYVLSLGGKSEGWLLLSQRENGRWHVWHDHPDVGHTVAETPSLSWAQGVAEEYVRNKGAAALCRKNAPWRQRPVSDGQKRALIAWKVPIRSCETSGDAADAITRAIAEAAMMRGRV